MDLTAPSKANEFLLAQILRQAEREGESYSEIELHALRWPLCGHTIEEDDALEDDLEKALPGDGKSSPLHVKVAGHLKRAYANDCREDPDTASQYEPAYETIRGSPFLLASLTSRDAHILSIVQACHLGTPYELMSMFLEIALPRYRYSVSPPPALLIVSCLSLAAILSVIALIVGAIVWKP